eukprot:gene1016-9849_t
MGCDMEDVDLGNEEPVDWEFSPFGLALGAHPKRYFVGAVVGNPAVVAAVLAALASGHANSLWPPAWWDAGAKTGVTPGQSCAAGCGGARKDCQSFCMWFTDNTQLSGKGDQKQTNAAPDSPIDIYTNHPWRHPGKSMTYSPCGIGGGNPKGCPTQ